MTFRGPLVAGYDEAIAALSDQRLSVAAMMAAGALDDGKLAPHLRDAVLTSLTNSDPPDHTRLRRLVSSVFTPPRRGHATVDRPTHR